MFLKEAIRWEGYLESWNLSTFHKQNNEEKQIIKKRRDSIFIIILKLNPEDADMFSKHGYSIIKMVKILTSILFLNKNT